MPSDCGRCSPTPGSRSSSIAVVLGRPGGTGAPGRARRGAAARSRTRPRATSSTTRGLGWRKKPGARVRYDRREYATEVAINANGLRDPERAYAAAARHLPRPRPRRFLRRGIHRRPGPDRHPGAGEVAARGRLPGRGPERRNRRLQHRPGIPLLPRPGRRATRRRSSSSSPTTTTCCGTRRSTTSARRSRCSCRRATGSSCSNDPVPAAVPRPHAAPAAASTRRRGCGPPPSRG